MKADRCIVLAPNIVSRYHMDSIVSISIPESSDLLAMSSIESTLPLTQQQL